MSENYPDMESYEIVEFIRNMSEGDMIEVYYQKGRFTHVKSVKLTVYDTGHGNKPLISCWDSDVDDTEDAHPSKHYHLESNTQQAGYKIRNISGPSEVDGSNIISIEKYN